MKLLSALLPILAAPFLQADWPAFRGPAGDGVAVVADLPAQWSKEENLRWKTGLPGPGSSSPIVVGERVIVTCWSGYGGELGRDLSQLKRHVVCLNRADGKLLWSKAVPASLPEDEENSMLMEHGYASSTPVSDGKRVYVFFGKSGALAFDLVDGKQLWQKELGHGSNSRRWGSAASPLLFEDKLIVSAFDESQALYALDCATGKELWKAPAEGIELAYSTPSLLKQGESTDIMLAVPQEVWGFNPSNGKLRWYLAHGLSGNVSPGIVQGAGLCYLFGGYPSTRSVAFAPGGKDDLGDKAIRWESNDSTYIPTPIFYEGHLYVITDNGLAQCMEAATGKLVYKERVMPQGGGTEGGTRRGGRGKPFYASPVLAAGKLYCQSRRNGMFVVAAKPNYELVGQFSISGDSSQWNASPAICGSEIYLRSDSAVYCVAR